MEQLVVVRERQLKVLSVIPPLSSKPRGKQMTLIMLLLGIWLLR